jgi:hypothetical protein
MKNPKRFQALKCRDTKEKPLLSATTNFSHENLNAYGSGTKMTASIRNNR